MPTVGTLAKGVPFFSCSSVTSAMKSSRGLLCLALAGAVVSEAAGRGFFKGASRGAWEEAAGGRGAGGGKRELVLTAKATADMIGAHTQTAANPMAMADDLSDV